MKGSTNAMRGSADVVQSTSSISILDTTIQNSTDSQPGLMSAADHQQMTADHATLSTTVSQMSTKQDKSLRFTNVSASSWAADTEFSDYGYKCTIPLTGVSSTYYSDVVFGVADALSGNYAPLSRTYDGGVYIWGKVNDAITIPSIVVEVF